MKKRILSIAICALISITSLAPVLPVKANAAPSTIPAFPGAEGGGMYASGGRGYDVYEVTNLNDSGTGSLRDAISADNRMIVFRVSGTINLSSDLSFSNRKNITIAGQTAPGDGICIAGYKTDVSNATNIIIRYLRFRPGSAHISSEPDAIGGNGTNYLMLDHISASWSTDESLSFYQNTNMTVQWSIISESLTLSGHYKGKHGYGGIWGGTNATFHHNLVTNHTSRMPRYGNGTSAGSITMANNVVYNWGFNNSYGGLADVFQVNHINNYFKPGPSTLDIVKGRILNPSEGPFYVSGNYLYGNSEVTADNTKGLQEIGTKATFSSTPFINDSYSLLVNQNNSTDYNKGVGVQNAQSAYDEVLNKAGAILPRRDAVDARVVQDVKDGKGRIINREYEVGGFPTFTYNVSDVPTDTDHDGMPDAWETSHGLNKDDAADGKVITTSGYSNLEIYLNSLADMSITPDNPVVKLTTPTLNEVFTVGGQITIDADATDKDGIAKVEFYVGKTNQGLLDSAGKAIDPTLIKVGESTTAPYSYTISDLTADTYFISARAYDTKGNATQSTSMPVYVNGTEVSGAWNSVDIGSTSVKGSGSLDDSTGVLTVKGSGKITGTADSFHFVYQPISGNACLTAKIGSLALLDNNTINGLMIRDGLETDATEAIISTSIVKADRDENGNGDKDDTYYATFFSSRMNKGDTVLTLDDMPYPQDTLPSLLDHTLPLWLKIERVDDEIITYTSKDGTSWTELARKTFSMSKDAYIGFVVDAGQPAIGDIYYNTAKFSNISITNSFSVTSVNITDIFGNSVSGLTSGLTAAASVTVNKNSLAIEDAVIAIQLCDAFDNVISTSYIKSKFGTGNTKTVKAGFSTPIGLTGLKIKAFVVNNMKDDMKISNEISIQ